MKAIEVLVRSAAWDRATQAAFRAHLAKNMRDSARLGYCTRKASFMNREKGIRTKRAALALMTWALASFRAADKESRAYALSMRAQLLEDVGDYAASPVA